MATGRVGYSPRRRIRTKALAWLARRPLTAAQAAVLLDTSPSNAAHILRRLMEQGLCTRRRASEVYYMPYEYSCSVEVVFK